MPFTDTPVTPVRPVPVSTTVAADRADRRGRRSVTSGRSGAGGRLVDGEDDVTVAGPGALRGDDDGAGVGAVRDDGREARSPLCWKRRPAGR